MVNKIIYFSSVSENTHRFISKVVKCSESIYPRLMDKNMKPINVPTVESSRLPLRIKEETIHTDDSFVLVTPTYGGESKRNDNGEKSVPMQVQKFLSEESNMKNLKGVIATGNINFGAEYCRSGDIISHEFNVPYLYRCELMGTKTDVKNVTMGLLEVS